MTPKIYLIAAADLKDGIGIQGKLPWDLKEDLAFFQKQTIKTDNQNLRNMVMMGQTTWESLPKAHRPLAGRKNVVLTQDKNFTIEGVDVAHSIEEGISKADERVESIYIIGGASIYKQTIGKKWVTGVYLTRIQKEFKCDAFFPKIPTYLKPEKIKDGEENGVKYEFLLYKRG